MASQIQGLKKVAAANRNKTKSQLRESNNYNAADRAEGIRQSAQTAMENHNGLSNTTALVGLRNVSGTQSK
jgi:hypothetical protein